MKRIVAIVLPQLACEIARRKRLESGSAATGPLGVILEPDGSSAAELPAAVLDAVEDEARRYGVRPGQRVTEAAALVASLSVQRVTHGELDAALGRVAEVALGFGPTAALQLREAAPGAPRTPWGDAPYDTVWLDATGAAHLAGGEEELLAELEERVGALGHCARLAIAGGPRLAQALARFAPGVLGTPGSRATGRYPIAPTRAEGSAGALASLPLQALPIEPETAGFLLRLGVFTVGDLARLPRAKAAARLGVRAPEILELAAGRDEAPLLPYAPPREILEEASFEEGVENAEALLFVLRGMVSRAAVRLLARGEACTRLEVELPLDRSIARLRLAGRAGEDGALGVAAESIANDEAIRFHVDLPAPLSGEADLLRAVRAKLERTELFAPAVGVRLRLAQIVPAPRVQLDLSRDQAADPDSLPALLAELSAEIGADRVGILSIEDAHRPEAQSRLVPATLGTERKGAARREQLSFAAAWTKKPDPIPPPARLLPTPISLGKVVKGGVVAIGGARGAGGEPQIFAIEKLAYLMRLDAVEWWSKTPASRDYARAWLASGDEQGRLARATRSKASAKAACGEALVYVVRKTGEVFLQGWYE
jgi:protein ImuB